MPYYEFVQNRGTESQSSEMLVLGTQVGRPCAVRDENSSSHVRFRVSALIPVTYRQRVSLVLTNSPYNGRLSTLNPKP